MSEKRYEEEVMLYGNLDDLMAIDDGLKDLYLKRQGLETSYVLLNDRILNLDITMIDQKQFIEYHPNSFSALLEKRSLNKNKNEYQELIKEKESVQNEFNKVNQNLEYRLESAYEQEFGFKNRVSEAVAEVKEKSGGSNAFNERVAKAQVDQSSVAHNSEVKETTMTMK